MISEHQISRKRRFKRIIRHCVLGTLVIAAAAAVLFMMPAKRIEAAGDVAINSKNFPDKVFREYVSENFDKDNNGSLSDAEIQAITYIDVEKYGISDLKGIELFVKLSYLNCDRN